MGAEVGPTLVCVIEKLVEQIEGRFAELSEQMSDPDVISDQRRYADVGRAYRALEPAHALAQVIKLAPTMGREQIIVMNMCGRGDKDVFTVGKILGFEL